MEQIATLLADIESGIDFSDESDVSFISLDTAEKKISQLRHDVDHLITHSLRLERLDSLPTVVFIGKPNVGKSSLINALTGQARSITSNIPGTTRDMLPAILHTPSGDIRLLDVPGEEPPTDDMRQKMMQARQHALTQADLIIQIIDNAIVADDPQLGATGLAQSRGQPRASSAQSPSLQPLPSPHIIQNKSDLCPEKHPAATLVVSAKTGQNIPQFRSLIQTALHQKSPIAADEIVLNHRHRALLSEVQSELQATTQFTQDASTFKRHPELLAADLRRALDLLGQITGTISPDEILGRIFSTFCIGK